MSLLRSYEQVALNDLLVASEKAVDYYRDAADFLDPLPPGETLRYIAREREALIERLEEAIHSLGDLPSVPDEDRETLGKFYRRVHASLASDEVRDVLQQRLQSEQALVDLLGRIREAGWIEQHNVLIEEAEYQVANAIIALKSLIENYAQ